LHDEPSQGDWELESPRPCAAGIEIEHAVARFLLGLVTVAGDHDVESGGFGLEIEAREIVQDIDGNAGELDDFGFGEFAGPCLLVDVASDRGDGGDGGEFVENFGIADVTGMNDVLRALERSQSFGAQQAVGVGDYTDDNGLLSSQFSVLGFGLGIHERIHLGMRRSAVHGGVGARSFQLNRQPA
jgi:hypothetical protein